MEKLKCDNRGKFSSNEFKTPSVKHGIRIMQLEIPKIMRLQKL